MNYSESPHETLERLRVQLKFRQEELIETEAHRADQLADVVAFEEKVEGIIGHLLDDLAALEVEVRNYNQRLNRMRNKTSFGVAVDNVEEQFRRTWEKPPPKPAKPPTKPPAPTDDRHVKQLYRKLARRFHPDLASDPNERTYRTEKMAAINDAYAARSLAELIALSEEEDVADSSSPEQGQTEAQMIEALKEEMERIDRRLKAIRFEIANVTNRSSVQLSMEVKIARRQGRDLLAEMKADLELKVAKKTAERDFLKSQFDQLGPQTRIGPR
jgi:predicted  nucleic acid-binding Zn-ribbon protein